MSYRKDYERIDYNYYRKASRYSKLCRRRKEIMRYKKIAFRFLITLMLVFAALLGLCSVRSYAKQTNDTVFVKNYKSIEVKSGDTLQDYVDLYMCIEFKTQDKLLEEIKSINHLKSETIHAGEYLIIPYYCAGN